MKIVIDVDENVFTRLFDNGTEDYAIVNDDLFSIAKAIRNGTPISTEGDLISREALKKSLNFIYDCAYIESKSKEGVASDIVDEIDNAPTITNGTYEQGFRVGAYGRLDELRPKGKWVEVEKQGKTGDGRIFTYTVVVCSECGEQFDLEGEKFCPHCGADMRGGK